MVMKWALLPITCYILIKFIYIIINMCDIFLIFLKCQKHKIATLNANFNDDLFAKWCVINISV